MLCQMLAASGVAGCPHSFFRKEDLADWAKDWGVPLDALPGSKAPSSDFLTAVLSEGKGNTPIFGLRLMRTNLPDLLSYLQAVSPIQPHDRAYLEHAFVQGREIARVDKQTALYGKYREKYRQKGLVGADAGK